MHSRTRCRSACVTWLRPWTAEGVTAPIAGRSGGAWPRCHCGSIAHLRSATLCAYHATLVARSFAEELKESGAERPDLSVLQCQPQSMADWIGVFGWLTNHPDFTSDEN